MKTQIRKSVYTLILLVIPVIADAQDFTGMDITSMYNAMAAQQNAQMQQQTQQIVLQVMQNPRFQGMYQQHLASGGSSTPEQYAYNYAATGGFTESGMRNYQNSEAASAAKIQGAWQGEQKAIQGYRDAYNGYASGYSSNQQEVGNSLMGNSTYVQPDSGSSSVLPHTWQTNSYNSFNGNTYYVDQSGQYYLLDPNNSGTMYPVHPTH